jgi:hypothetical protein
MVLPLEEPRKQRVDLFQSPRIGCGSAGISPLGGDQVLPHREVSAYEPAFGNQPEPQARDPMRRHAVQRLPVEADMAGAARQQAHERAHQRGFAHAVAAHQSHELAFGNRE